MKSLEIVSCVLVAGAGLALSQSPEELCTLASHNISLMSMDRTPFFISPSVDTRLYLSLCHKLGDLPVNNLCDRNAFACITKIKGE